MAIKTFLYDESGAVTVDWVVLTAALVGLALAVIGLLREPFDSQASAIGGQLGRDIIRTDFSDIPPADDGN